MNDVESNSEKKSCCFCAANTRFLYDSTMMFDRSHTQPLDDRWDFEEIGAFGEVQKFDLPGYAEFITSKGLVTVELYKDASPETVDKFLVLWK